MIQHINVYLIHHLFLDSWQLCSPQQWSRQITPVCITIRGYTGLHDGDTSLKFSPSQCNFSCFKQPCFIIFFSLCWKHGEQLLNIWKLRTTWIIIFCNVGEKSTSTFFYARLMCALLFSLDKSKNYQRTNLQNKINCLYFLVSDPTAFQI